MSEYSIFYNTDWVAIAQNLLNNRPVNLSLSVIAKETNLTASWLSQFAAGQIPNPSIYKVRSVIEWFDAQ